MKKNILIIILALTASIIFAEETDFLFDLSGTWKAKIGDSLDYASILIDESTWTDISLPSANFFTKNAKELFRETTILQKSFIWFRKSIQLNSIPQGQVYMQIGEIQNADEVYLNGIRIGATGSFPPNFHSGWRNFRNYSIDPKLFVKGSNTIAIRVFSDVENWITGPILLTNNSNANFEKMMRDLWQINIFEYFFILLLWVTVYFLIYYTKRPKEIEYLYFSLTCIVMAIIVLTWFYDIRYPFIPVLSNYIYGMCQVALFFFPPLLSVFVYTYINKTLSLQRKILTFIGPAIGTLILLFSMERSWLLGVRSIFLALQPIFIGVIYVDLFKAVRRKKAHSWQMVFTVVPLTLFSIRDILAFTFGIGTDGNAYFVYGIPPFFFLFAIQFIEQFVNTLNQTEKLKTSFYRFVPVEFLKIIGRPNINDVQLGDSTHRELAVLFTDIRQFTKISENMEPKDVFKLLNSYLSYMVPIIQQNGGFVDKYIGDAIMALFPKKPEDAILAAIALRKTLNKFNEAQKESNGLIVKSGTGIHFGELILGTIGDADRMEGTVVADSVNLASRIESLTRYYGCDILISSSIKLLVQIPTGAKYRFIDRVVVAGRNSIVEIYEVLWDIENPQIKARYTTLVLFTKGVKSYFNQNLQDAKKYLLETIALDPEDTVCKIYLERIDQIEQEKAKWQDHIIFNEK